MTSQKQIAITLDLAARRADAVSTGASKKQVWFLAGLIARAGEEADGVMESGLLTSRMASRAIDGYLKEETLVATGLSRQQARVQMMGA